MTKVADGDDRRPGRSRRFRAVRAVAALSVVALGLLLVLGIGRGDPSVFPPRAGDEVAIFLVSNGFHSGLVLPRAEAQASAGREGRGAVVSVATRFGYYPWIEVGWGDEAFYREVPTLEAINWRLGLLAILGLGSGSVVHVVGVEGDPREMFGGADLVRIGLSPQGFGRLLAELDASFARGPDQMPSALGAGLYGPSLFYRGVGRVSAFNVCNHWTARLLGAAGVPVSPLLATWPRGLVVELGLRAGLRREAGTIPSGTAHD